MAFMRIVKDQMGRAVIEDLPMPGDRKRTPEDRATEILEAKDRSRSKPQMQELTPVKNTEHQPHPPREPDGPDLPEKPTTTLKAKVTATTSEENTDG